MGNLKNPSATKHDFEVLNEHLPKGVRMSDIDGHIELSGHHLFIEVKCPGERDISTGVLRKMMDLAGLGVMVGKSFEPRCTCILVCAEKPFEVMHYHLITTDGLGPKVECNTLEFCKRVERWVPKGRRRKGD
jgi:hypothetical protein